jgi:hypothetical protein
LGIRQSRLAASALAATILLAAGFVPVAAAGSRSGSPGRDTAAPGATPPVVTLTAGGQTFEIRGRPGDAAWAAAIKTGLATEVQALEDLTGFTAPGGTIAIVEVVDGPNDFGISYDAAGKTLYIPQSAGPAVVADALARIWFNPTLFSDTWVNEGLAAFGEQVAGAGNYVPCSAVPAYPGSGGPNLANWTTLDGNSTIVEQNVADWQTGASCAFFTAVAQAAGPANFRNVLAAAATRRPAYGAAGGTTAGGTAPVGFHELLDLIDEVGLVPAGGTDPDMAQKLLGGFGLLDDATLAARSQARAEYHAIEARAGSWSIAPAIRAPMQSWDYAAAETAIATAGQILDLRDAVEKTIPSYAPDGSTIQTGFSTASTQAELDGVRSVMQQMSDASGTIARAKKLRDGSHSFLQSIGLLGADLDTPIKHAVSDLQSVQPARAQTDARSAIDEIDGAATVGLLRVALTVGFLGLLLVVSFWVVLLWRRARRRKNAGSAPPDDSKAASPSE